MSRRSQISRSAPLDAAAVVPPLALSLALFLTSMRAIRAAEAGDSPPSTVFVSLRAMQSTYSLQGGDVVLEWKVEGMKFTWAVIMVDDNQPETILVDQDQPGVVVRGLTPGHHKFIVRGIT